MLHSDASAIGFDNDVKRFVCSEHLSSFAQSDFAKFIEDLLVRMAMRGNVSADSAFRSPASIQQFSPGGNIVRIE